MKNDSFWSAKYYLAESNTTMANPQTAAEWQQAAAELEQQRIELMRQFDAVRAQQTSLRQTILGYNRVITNINSTPEQKAQAQQQKTETQAQIAQLESQAAQLEAQADRLRDQRNAAQANARTAAAGPPNTSSNTPPASETPLTSSASPATPTTTAAQTVELTPAEIALRQQTAEFVNREPTATLRNVQANASGATPSDDNQQSTISTPNIVATEVTRDQAAFLEANTSGDAPPQVSREQTAFLEANLQELASEPTISTPNIVDTGISREQAQFLEANTGGDAPAALTQAQAQFLEANDPGGSEDTINRSYGITTPLRSAQSSATRQDVENAKARGDWRVRISLASSANYFYRAEGQEGIMYPLKETDGVIFPYSPTISVTYSASYDQQQLTHSNYKSTHYTGSSVDNISISCDFTAQDTYEANYLLATIHFFRSLTKMFYGQDQNPIRGTPPPLCYLHGYGDFQFDKHPMAITGFTYSLPNDVDYIKCNTSSFVAGQPLYNNRKSNSNSARASRGAPTELVSNNTASPFKSTQVQPTYVPTRIALSITAIPVIARYDSSNIFSLKDYANGRLLQGTKQKWGGFW